MKINKVMRAFGRIVLLAGLLLAWLPQAAADNITWDIHVTLDTQNPPNHYEYRKRAVLPHPPAQPDPQFYNFGTALGTMKLALYIDEVHQTGVGLVQLVDGDGNICISGQIVTGHSSSQDWWVVDGGWGGGCYGGLVFHVNAQTAASPLLVSPQGNRALEVFQGRAFPFFNYSIKTLPGRKANYSVTIRYDGAATDWLTPNPNSGEVGDADTVIQFSPNATTSKLRPGTYKAAIVFINKTVNAPNILREVVLTVKPRPYQINVATMPPDWGTVTIMPASPDGKYAFGTEVTVVANATNGRFQRWWWQGQKKQERVEERAFTFRVNSDRTLIAEFKCPNGGLAVHQWWASCHNDCATVPRRSELSPPLIDKLQEILSARANIAKPAQNVVANGAINFDEHKPGTKIGDQYLAELDIMLSGPADPTIAAVPATTNKDNQVLVVTQANVNTVNLTVDWGTTGVRNLSFLGAISGDGARGRVTPYDRNGIPAEECGTIAI